MSYQAIAIPDVEAERRAPRTLSPLVAVALLAVGAVAGSVFTRSTAAGSPELRAAACSSTTRSAGEAALDAYWLQFSVTGACTISNLQDLLEGADGTTFTCPSLVSSDSSYAMSLYDGTVDSYKDFHANWTLTLPGGSMTFEGVGATKAQHGIDDIVSGMATVGGRIRDATGDYEGCEGAISLTSWYGDGEVDDMGTEMTYTGTDTWAASIVYEWP